MRYEELYKQIRAKGTCLCVGLDTDLAKIPTHLKNEQYPVFEFNKAIIDSTAPYCVAYKPNIAFYEAAGVSGWMQLEMTVRYLREKYPEMFLIADAKRGDIGNTAAEYARTFFETMDFDAVTLSPYMGRDAIDPFLKYEGKWAIILALTSNPSADDFETAIDSKGVPLYEKVIRHFTDTVPESSSKIMFVVGATRAEKLAEIREFCPDHFLLVPGVGAQGGSAEEVIKYGSNSSCGLLINSSRGIIYASSDKNFASEAAKAASKAIKL
jgi:orotidine-5'-phosphate decarboxylase